MEMPPLMEYRQGGGCIYGSRREQHVHGGEEEHDVYGRRQEEEGGEVYGDNDILNIYSLTNMTYILLTYMYNL